MPDSSNTNASLHSELLLSKNEHFLKAGQLCTKIGYLESGLLRGYTLDSDGKEITTHFFQEGDMIIGSFIPDIPIAMSIQAIEESVLSVANYAEVMSVVNKDLEVTDIVTRTFNKMTAQSQARLVALLNLNSVEKYRLFTHEYPDLINRIPHYYIAQYLGITPTQLSRTRKQIYQQM